MQGLLGFVDSRGVPGVGWWLDVHARCTILSIYTIEVCVCACSAGGDAMLLAVWSSVTQSLLGVCVPVAGGTTTVVGVYFQSCLVSCVGAICDRVLAVCVRWLRVCAVVQFCGVYASSLLAGTQCAGVCVAVALRALQDLQVARLLADHR